MDLFSPLPPPSLMGIYLVRPQPLHPPSQLHVRFLHSSVLYNIAFRKADERKPTVTQLKWAGFKSLIQSLFSNNFYCNLYESYLYQPIAHKFPVTYWTVNKRSFLSPIRALVFVPRDVSRVGSSFLPTIDTLSFSLCIKPLFVGSGVTSRVCQSVHDIVT